MCILQGATKKELKMAFKTISTFLCITVDLIMVHLLFLKRENRYFLSNFQEKIGCVPRQYFLAK